MEELREKVEKALDEIRPMLMADGGNVHLVDIKDGIVHVHLIGACAGCPAAQMTLQEGISQIIRERVPEVKGVVAV